MELFKLFGTISANNEEAIDAINETNDVAKDSESKFTGFLGKIGSGAAKMAAAVGAGMTAAATGIGALAKQSLDSYADYEQLVGGVETLFKDSAQTVSSYAEKAFETAGLSANEYMETVTSFSASLLASLDGDTSAAAEKANLAITDMSDNANKMGSSMESIQNAYQGFAKQNYTMLDNLKLGYGGTKEEMERLLADAEKISGQKFDLSSYSDIVDAIHVVQTEMGITGTTAKEAATTISGSIGMMKSSWQNLLTSFGTDDGSFDGALENFVNSVVTVAGNIAPRLVTIIPSLVSGLVQVVQTLASFIPDLIGQLLPALLEGATSLLNGIVSALPSLLNVLVSALPMIIDGLVQIITGIVNAMPTLIQTLLDALPEIIPMLLDGITQIILSISQNLPVILQSLIESLPTILTSIVQSLSDNLPILINGLIEMLLAIVQALPDILVPLIEALPDIIEMLLTTILENLPVIIQGLIQLVIAIVQALPEIIMALIQAVPQIVMAIINALQNAFPQFFSWLSSAWNSITGFIQTGFKLIGSIIDAAFKIITLPFRFIWENCKETVMSVWNTINGFLSGAFNAISETVSSVWNGIKDNISSAINVASETISTVVNTISGTVSGVFNSIKDTVTTVWEDIKSAITTPIETARDTISGIVETIKGFFNFDFELPKIKLPHFSISPSGWKVGDLLEGEIPTLGIEWYAKAVNEPYMFTQPTVVGNKGFGEAGDEIVYGRKNLMQDIKDASQIDTTVLQEKMNRMIELLEKLLGMKIYLNNDVLVGELAPAMDNALGDIYNAKGRGGRSTW